MMSLSPVLLLPLDVLIPCLNAAVASLVACAIAVVLSRRAAWSLPVRHALLVAAFAASLTAPLLVSLVHLPSLWAINVVATVEPPPAVITQPGETIHGERPLESPVATTITATGTCPVRPTSAGASAVAPAASVPNSTAPAPIRQEQSPTAAPWARVIGTLLCGLWFAGTAIGLARAITGLIRLRRWIQSVTVADSPALAAVARSAANSMGLRNSVPIHRSSLLPAPVTFGLLQPRIVLPADIETTLAPDQLRAVIQHEMAHISRRDLWIGLLQRAAAIVYWWNPLVLLANRQLADLREQICDDIAIRELPDPSVYAATLINLAERCSLCTPVPATLGIGSSPAGQLESRIRRLLSTRQDRCLRLTRRAIIGVSAVGVVMTATILLAQVQVKSPRKADRPIDQTKASSAQATRQ